MNPQETQQVVAHDEKGFHSLRALRLALPMSDWKPQCHKRKRHFKWLLTLSRTPHASRPSLSLQMSQKSLCNRSGILSRRTILDICPKVEGVNFTDVPDDDTTLAFLIKLGYKASNDKLRKFRIDIPWGMFYRENVDYPELIWEDLAYQIDHRKEKRSRHENMLKYSSLALEDLSLDHLKTKLMI
ncbi:hypothetical protein Tco_0620509 [Tanacetum coccineum]